MMIWRGDLGDGGHLIGIIAVAGIPEIVIGDTLADPENGRVSVHGKATSMPRRARAWASPTVRRVGVKQRDGRPPSRRRRRCRCGVGTALRDGLAVRVAEQDTHGGARVGLLAEDTVCSTSSATNSPL
jgi:hypothetical protein